MPRTAPAANPGVSTDGERATIAACVRFATVARAAVYEEERRRSRCRREREATVSAGATPDSEKHSREISRARFGFWRDASTRHDGSLDQPSGTRRARSWRRRRASPETQTRVARYRPAQSCSVPPRRIARGGTRPPRRARASSPDASVRKTSFLSSRVAPASRPRARHARPRSRGSPPGGGTSRSRHEMSERTTWRNASSLTRRAQSSAGRARKGTGHLEAREPRTRILESGWVPSAPGGGTSH
jgi:hypothetical protein